ncbi:peptidase [Halalkalibacillus sediminis]|uniref:Peptidase n=1 Tax=Halalkalibacillus sediminis TaxID=2018042 RepID=A0A2I0QXZ8_9BACI|nr:ImmA/IrrE family metallo-endopeptidase [Halalkalibacillus sediminis]PKR79216.1 peptidase [Halalkalibacillus sediminis]
MFEHYTTALEDWVSHFYKKQKMYSVQDLSIRKIARYYHIFVHQKPVPARHDIVHRYRGIIVDSRDPIEHQREQFFHELCHILRHCGHQSMMPEAFRELQEWDARHFTLYAALPYHMLRFYDFSDDLIIGTIAEDFKVTKELVSERLNRIYRNQKCTNTTADGTLWY